MSHVSPVYLSSPTCKLEAAVSTFQGIKVKASHRLGIWVK